MSTLKDVARLAHCHPSTVSRALSNTSYIHPDTRARIMAAVEELSYHPDIIARGLKKGKRHTIGMIVPNLHITIFDDIAHSIDTAARSLGYSVLFCHTNDDPETERECLDRLRSGFTDGIIIASTGRNNSMLRDIHSDGLAVVQIIRQHDDSISSIVSDYRTGSYNAVKYLYAKGCRKIALVNGIHKGVYALSTYRTRYEGYVSAVNELGLAEICVCSGSVVNTFEEGCRCVGELLKVCPDADAIMTAVDIFGMAALKVLRERDIDVPDECRVVSLTGCLVGHLLEKSLTSFEIPAELIGDTAVRMLVDEIEAPKDSKPKVQNVVLPASLSERESS